MRAPAGLHKPPAGRLGGYKAQRKRRKSPRRGLASPRRGGLEDLNFVVFIRFYSVFTFCTDVVVVAHVVGAWYTDVEPKAGLVDSAMVLCIFVYQSEGHMPP